MSDTENRKSMDDVLASIRKIVRAEKDPEGAEEATTVPMDAEPAMPETAGMDATPVDGGAPLELTPDMMMDGEAAGSATEYVSQAVETVQETAETAMSIDPEMIRGMVRDVVMEQLGGGDAEGLIRGIIRDELTTGDVGANISTNVLKLIQSEIGKAMGNS